MRLISVWHAGIAEVTSFGNAMGFAESLVSVVPDPEMRFSFWSVYRVTPEQLDKVKALPRLTWKE